MRWIAPILFATLLAACGPPMEWARPNTSVADFATDQQECHRLARDQAFQESIMGGMGFGMFGPWGGRDRRYRHDPFWGSGYGGREQREAGLRDFCLRSRGYQLRPVGAG